MILRLLLTINVAVVVVELVFEVVVTVELLL